MNNKYPLVLYLNQKYVFDVLAMIEGGFYQVETVKASQGSGEEVATKFAGNVGITNAFSLLGISFSADRAKKQNETRQEDSSFERIHTPNSLFARMRETLHSENLIVIPEPDTLAPGEFVEFNATLRKNPVIEMFDSFVTAAEMFGAITNQIQPTQDGKSQQNRNQRTATPKPSVDTGNQPVMDQIKALSQQLKNSSTFDIIGDIVDNDEAQTVLTLDRSFLTDPTYLDLLYGEYTVIGKVTKVLKEDSQDHIDLLRRTGFGVFDEAVLVPMKLMSEQMKGSGLRIPELVTEIEGPAIQVIPIAIFS